MVGWFDRIDNPRRYDIPSQTKIKMRANSRTSYAPAAAGTLADEVLAAFCAFITAAEEASVVVVVKVDVAIEGDTE